MQFLYPNVLFFMLIPTILLAFFITTNKKNIEKHFTKEALSKLQVANKFLSQSSRNILFFIAILLMIISLARPVLDKKEKEIKQDINSYILALDVSKSMFAQDLPPNRYTFAKTKLLNFIENSKDKEIGIILFSSSSYILSPLTQDITSLKELVKNLDNSIQLENGSEISTAIKTASKLLKNKTNKNLILLTDGTDKQEFKEEIALANNLNINIYTIGMATNKKSAIKLNENQYLTDEKGNIVTVALNEQIKHLSLNTNAAYINFTFNNSDINQILQVIDEKKQKEKNDIKKYKVYTELFYFPLALALFILLIAFSSLPKLKYLPFVLLIFISTDTKASITDFKIIDKATTLYENQNYKEASKEFKKIAKNSEAHYNLANSLYKEKKYKEAIDEYKKVVTSNEDLEFKKLHNLGNSYTKINKLQDAIKMYEKALQIKKDKQTKENLEIVKKALEKNKQENQNNKDKQEDKNNQKENNQDNKKDKQKDKNQENSQKNKQKNQEEKNENPKENKQKEEKDSENLKEKKQENSKDKNSSLEKIKKEVPISDIEEKKWLKELENSSAVFLKKDEQKNTNSKW
ncbi:hypothetical protein CRU99_04610 [Malaciobacter mytili]|uniref:VWA domain-containing protein n=1 Tax=Malaciobacter mytili TaxID=603050 RepID=UPI00100B1289|nr:VWA domain-containing protein [Malaciobacter mytili]RXI44862.1 hypothetical protein CRU99_04610 [Malaciobacter mytili]